MEVDLSHRLTAAHVDLKWTFSCSTKTSAHVVHWSALTRVMRELVSTFHRASQAQQLDIALSTRKRPHSADDQRTTRRPQPARLFARLGLAAACASASSTRRRGR